MVKSPVLHSNVLELPYFHNSWICRSRCLWILPGLLLHRCWRCGVLASKVCSLFNRTVLAWFIVCKYLQLCNPMSNTSTCRPVTQKTQNCLSLNTETAEWQNFYEGRDQLSRGLNLTLHKTRWMTPRWPKDKICTVNIHFTKSMLTMLALGV